MGGYYIAVEPQENGENRTVLNGGLHDAGAVCCVVEWLLCHV